MALSLGLLGMLGWYDFDTCLCMTWRCDVVVRRDEDRRNDNALLERLDMFGNSQQISYHVGTPTHRDADRSANKTVKTGQGALE